MNLSKKISSIFNSELKGKSLQIFLILIFLIVIIVIILGYLAAELNNPMIIFIPILIIVTIFVSVGTFFLYFVRKIG